MPLASGQSWPERTSTRGCTSSRSTAGTTSASHASGCGRPVPRLGFVGVSRPHRRRGVALALLSRAFGVLASRGIPEVTTEIDETNTASRGLLEGLGARRVGGYLSWSCGERLWATWRDPAIGWYTEAGAAMPGAQRRDARCAGDFFCSLQCERLGRWRHCFVGMSAAGTAALVLFTPGAAGGVGSARRCRRQWQTARRFRTPAGRLRGRPISRGLSSRTTTTVRSPLGSNSEPSRSHRRHADLHLVDYDARAEDRTGSGPRPSLVVDVRWSASEPPLRLLRLIAVVRCRARLAGLRRTVRFASPTRAALRSSRWMRLSSRGEQPFRSGSEALQVLGGGGGGVRYDPVTGRRDFTDWRGTLRPLTRPPGMVSQRVISSGSRVASPAVKDFSTAPAAPGLGSPRSAGRDPLRHGRGANDGRSLLLVGDRGKCSAALGRLCR